MNGNKLVALLSTSFFVLVVLLTPLCSTLQVHAQEEQEADFVSAAIFAADKDSLQQVLAQTNNDKHTISSCLLRLGNINMALEKFAIGFDQFQEAMHLATTLNDSVLLMRCHRQLSGAYFRFKKKQEGETHLTAYKKYARELLRNKRVGESERITLHHVLYRQARSQNNLAEALAHVDTCFAISNKLGKPKIEQLNLYLLKTKLLSAMQQDEAAAVLLNDLEKFCLQQPIDNQPARAGHMVSIYWQQGLIAERAHKNKKALACFQKASTLVRKHKVYQTQLVGLYRRESVNWAVLGNYKMAFERLKHSHQLSEQYFNVKGNKHRDLFQLRGKYMQELEEQQKIVAAQKLELAQKEKSVIAYQLFFVSVLLALVIVAFFIKQRMQRMQHESERKFIQKQAEEKANQNKQALLQKNKELTAYTLKVIEKDDLIQKLTAQLNQFSDKIEVKQMLASVKNQNENHWDEFNSRFVAVNDGFYERLLAKFPDLSSTDLKHCALMKLNFSVKEMANLLGISAKSVNMSRYRIRKKMGLERGVNLNSFLAGF